MSFVSAYGDATCASCSRYISPGKGTLCNRCSRRMQKKRGSAPKRQKSDGGLDDVQAVDGVLPVESDVESEGSDTESDSAQDDWVPETTVVGNEEGPCEWQDFTNRFEVEFNSHRSEMQGTTVVSSIGPVDSVSLGSETEDEGSEGTGATTEDIFDLELLGRAESGSGDGDTVPEDTTASSGGLSDTGVVPSCRNCRREKTPLDDMEPAEMEVRLGEHGVSELQFRVVWKTFRRVDIKRASFVSLCKECAVILLKTEARARKEARKNGEPSAVPWRCIWPVYVWKFLTHERMLSEHGSDVLHFIPSQWWKYWMSALLLEHGDVFTYEGCLTYNTGTHVVLDVGAPKRAFSGILRRNRLGELKHGCDRYLYAVVLCPWGCSSYYHTAGMVSFDAIVNRYFPYLEWSGKVASATEKAKVASARGDFFSFLIDMHLHNPDWSVHPSVFYDSEIGPVFLTCEDHRGGTRLRYFHLPRTGFCLPSVQPESLSHAVLRAKTLHTTRAHKYSTTFQLNKCTATYSGLDSCTVSDKRDFRHSHVSDIQEARSYLRRDDLKGLAARLAETGVISGDMALNFGRRAGDLFGNKSGLLDELCAGATVMTLNDAMNLQKVLATPQVLDIAVVSVSGSRVKTIKRHWPAHLIRVHPCNGYGAPISVAPFMGRTNGRQDCRLLWTVSHMLLNVPLLWELVSASIRSTDQWHGYLVSYLTRRVLRQSSYRRNEDNPFYVSSKDSRMKPGGLMELLLGYQERHAGEGVVLDRGVFRPSDLCVLLREETAGGGLAIVECPVQLSEVGVNVTDCVASKDAIMFVIGIKGPCTGSLPMRLHGPPNVTYELRFVSTSETGTSSDNWKASIWCRHGTALFLNWWTAQRTGGRGGISGAVGVGDLSGLKWEFFDAAVYVKTEVVSLERYRRDYLRYMGGQTCANCDTHRVPLITSPPKSLFPLRPCGGATGAGNVCPKDESFQCPVVGCRARICKACWRKTPAGETVFVAGGQDPVHDPSGVSGLGGGSDCLSEDRSEVLEVGTVASADSGDSPRNSDISNGDKTTNEPYDFSNLATGFDCVGIGTGDFAPSDGESDAAGEHPIPTTHAQSSAGIIERDFDTMGASVFLNKCGTMLVRRNNQLQATRRERHLIERVISRPEVGTVPLVYLEGILFPSIFWSLPHAADGGVVGSIPTSLFCQHSTRKQYGIASISDHAKSRLKSVGGTASTDPRYLSFLFDSLANGAIEGHDTRVVLSRGFEESMGPAGMRMRNKDDDFYTDTIDNRGCVHDLCASEKEKAHDLFLTLTCNQREHFGVRKIKRYIDDGEALANYKKHLLREFPAEKCLTPRAEAEVQQCFHEAARNMITRNWMEVRLIILKYLLKSDEQPLGKVLKIFSRDEYQSESGNLSHMHMLIALEQGYDDPEGRSAIQKLVRGFVADMVTEDEAPAFMAEGVVDDWDDLALMKEQARMFLPHRHSARCLRRTGRKEEDLICRVPDTRMISPDISQFYELIINVQHSKEAVGVMGRLGLCGDAGGDGSFLPEREFLIAKRIYAPARFGEGNITPVIGKLFAATRSTMNVQICTSHGTIRYVVKYLVKIDENNYIVFSANQRNPDDMKAEKVFLHNTKITSSAINEKKKLDAGRHRARPRGRAMPLTEMLQIIYGYPQVFCNVEFIKVSTLPLGERAGTERITPMDKYRDLESRGCLEGGAENMSAFDVMFPLVAYRRRVFRGRNSYRCHTVSQIALLNDQMNCPVSLDRVFVFGVRPPELLFMGKLEWYFRFFERSKLPLVRGGEAVPFYLNSDLRQSAFVDGLGHQVRIRPLAIPYVHAILQSEDVRCQREYKPVITLLLRIGELYSDAGITLGVKNSGGGGSNTLNRNSLEEWSRYQDQFVAYYDSTRALPVPVFSNVKPLNAAKFVIHLLLSMGHFKTESDLWVNGSIVDAFRAARLVPPGNGPATRDEVDAVLLDWIEQQLRYYPIGSKKFDEYIVAADAILESVLVHDAIPISEIPPCLYTSLVQETSAKIDKHIAGIKENLVDATLKSMAGSLDAGNGWRLPTKEQLMKATKADPVQWDPVLPRNTRQSPESCEEQIAVQVQCMKTLDEYTRPSKRATRNYLIAGPPGAGKTHCLGHSIIYALTKGLTVITTSLLADRAFLLGGIHLHQLCKIQVRDKGSAHRLAELAVIALQRHPEFFAFLRRVDVTFLDEAGQISAEFLAVLDIIFRKVRGSALFMGGVQLIATIDQVQLRPINGLPFLLSPYVLLTFKMGRLVHYVRCSNCAVLQEMNEIARRHTSDKNEWETCLSRLKELVSEHCTFVESWEDGVIGDDVLRIFPKREEASSAVRRFLERKKAAARASGKRYASVLAEDTMISMESHGDWRTASAAIRSQLNRATKEPRSLDFFEGAVYQFTHNSPGKYNNTQLCVLVDVPAEAALALFREVEVYTAPAGTKTIDVTGVPKDGLIAMGFAATKVGAAPVRPVNVWSHGVKAKRRQYGLKHHVASTIHSAIGHSVTRVATELGAGKELWERAMVVVLISRVSRAVDLIFVGDKAANIEALLRGLRSKNQYDEYMNHVVDVLTQQAAPGEVPTLDLDHHPFRPKDIELPCDSSGVVYLLVSTVDGSSLYIGYTFDMQKRYYSHNSGYGAVGTCDPNKRPWALFAYVTGFAGDRTLLRGIERGWQVAVHRIRPSDPFQAVSIGKTVVSENYPDAGLLMVVAGERNCTSG